jgi:hypothetical protein
MMKIQTQPEHFSSERLVILKYVGYPYSSIEINKTYNCYKWFEWNGKKMEIHIEEIHGKFKHTFEREEDFKNIWEEF